MNFPGIIPAVLVPFDRDGAIDVPGLEANVSHLLDHGVHGIVVNGTLGEAASLSHSERALVVETVLRVAGGRVPVVVGVSAPSTAAACAHATAARQAGATGVMSLPPLNYRGSEAELAAFFAAVAEAAGLPLMAYNNPESSGIDLDPGLITQIAADVPGLVAVKECSGDARRIAALLAASDLEVLVGGDDWALEGFAAGATGWVSGVANVAPEQCTALLEHVAAGQLAEARAVNRRILPLARLDMTPHLVQYFKGALDAVGLHGGPCRPPRLALGEAEQEVLRAAVGALREPVTV
ncbi:MAG TPA: dihydrodipicolinate synthase family protein [Solirubrobacteraceae bacterium]